MSVDIALQTAAASVGLPASPNRYTGDALEYITTNYEILPSVYAERAPRAARYIVQVHYYRPHGENPNATIRQLSRALWSEGFTWPSVVNASDDKGQHFVLECEYTDGGGFYG